MHRHGATPPRSAATAGGRLPTNPYASISAVISSPRPPASPAADAVAGPVADTDPVPTRHVSDRVWWVLAGLVVVTGLGAQLRVWASDRGFWGDELYIADNVQAFGLRGLAGVLRHNQLAPTGWLYVEKALYLTLGTGEQVLRFPSLVAAATVLLVGGWVAYRAVGRWGALGAMALIASSPKILEYAGELKQYAFEAAAALLVLVATDLGLRAVGTLRERRRVVLVAALLGLFCAAVSYTALIVLAGATAGAVVWLLAGRRRTDAWIVAGTAAPGLLLAAVMILRRLAHPLMAGQDTFFPNGLPPEHSGPLRVLAWLPTMWRGFVATPLEWQYPLLVLLLVIGGLVAMVRRGRGQWAAMLGGTLLAAVAVAAVRAFPFEERVALYLVAPVLITVVAAIDGAVRLAVFGVRRALSGVDTSKSTRDGRALAVAAALVLVLIGGVVALGVSVRPALAAGVAQARSPLYRDPFRDAMRDLARQLRPGDVVLLYSFSDSQGLWYGPALHVPIAGLAFLRADDACAPATVTAALRGAHRVWYLKGAHFSQHPDDYQRRVAAALETRATFVSARDYSGYTSAPATAASEGTGWELFDLDAGPDPDPLRPGPNPAFACLDLVPLVP
jgi:hypothetical protein